MLFPKQLLSATTERLEHAHDQVGPPFHHAPNKRALTERRERDRLSVLEILHEDAVHFCADGSDEHRDQEVQAGRVAGRHPPRAARQAAISRAQGVQDGIQVGGATMGPRPRATAARKRPARTSGDDSESASDSGAVRNTRLDEITNESVQQLKFALQAKSVKTTNNVLTVLAVLLKKAVEWSVIDTMPCTIRLLKVPKASMAFHDFDDYEKLVQAAARIDMNTYGLVLLGGDAGSAK
jgi:hypothetical protein